MVGRVKNSSTVAVRFSSHHGLRLEIFLEVLQEGILINDFGKMLHFALIIIKSDAEPGDVSLAFKALPLLDA